MSHRTALLQGLVRDLYGPPASVVVCLLDKSGQMTGRDIQDHCQLPTRVLQNVLIVLYKHSCINIHFSADKGRTTLRYSLNHEGVLMTLRRSKFLLFAQDRWGIAGKFILLQFLKLGIVTPEAAVKGAISDYNSLKTTLYPDGNVSHTEVSLGKMRSTLETMYTSGALKACPTMDDLCQRAATEAERLKAGGAQAPTIKSARAKSNARKRGEDENAQKRVKRVTKKRRAGDTEIVTSASMEVAGALLAETQLFGDSNAIEDAQDRNGRSSRTSGSGSGASGRRTGEGGGSQKTELPTTPFKANYDYLNLEMGKQVVENFIATRWNNAMIVRLISRTLLQRARKTSVGIICDGMTFDELCIGVNKLIQEANAKDTGDMLPEYDSDMLFKALENLTRHSDKSIKMIKGGSASGSGYQLDWGQAKGLLQHRIICQLIQTRFGIEGTRVFALILDRDGQATAQIRSEGGAVDCGANDNSAFMKYSRFWSDAEISEYALLSPADARACAGALAAAGYINKHAADVVNAAPSTMQNRHYWVFGATEADALETAIESCYQYIASVFERKDVEVEKLQKLVLKTDTMTPEIEFEMTSREIAEDVLEASLSGIDQALLVLRDCA